MSGSSMILYLVFLLKSVVILCAHGLNIQVFKHENFTGLVWQSSSTGHCTNVPWDKITLFHSIRTDTCFIAYWNPNCKSSRTDKYLPGDIILPSTQVGRYRWIASFHTCNEEEGGNQLNVDITKYDRSYISPDVLESYKNVCSCVNVPQNVQNMSKWYIDNHHNDLLAYYEPDCSVNKWNSKFIPAGNNDDSNNMHRLQRFDSLTKKTYSIQSLGPDQNATYFKNSCISTYATNQSTYQYEIKSKWGLDATHDKSIFQSDALMNSLKKLWSQSKKGETSFPKSDLTCMSCFDH